MNPSKILQAILGIVVSAGFFGIVWIVATMVIPTENRDAFTMLIGAAIGAFTTVVGFTFGSSIGSQRKDELRQP